VGAAANRDRDRVRSPGPLLDQVEADFSLLAVREVQRFRKPDEGARPFEDGAHASLRALLVKVDDSHCECELIREPEWCFGVIGQVKRRRQVGLPFDCLDQRQNRQPRTGGGVVEGRVAHRLQRLGADPLLKAAHLRCCRPTLRVEVLNQLAQIGLVLFPGAKRGDGLKQVPLGDPNQVVETAPVLNVGVGMIGRVCIRRPHGGVLDIVGGHAERHHRQGKTIIGWKHRGDVAGQLRFLGGHETSLDGTRAREKAMEPALFFLGTSARKFPTRCISAHIPAHSFSGLLTAASGNPCKVLHSQRAALGDLPNCHAEGRGFESHQPLFHELPARGRFGFGAGCRNQMEPSPHIAWRLAAISVDSALHWSRGRGSRRTARYPRPMAQERITVDPNRMRGLPSIRDTRVTVSAVLGQLAAGASIDELLADYPYLEREDVLAALEYAAAAAQERELAVVAPAA
jgi:uncharacterized protein (DUF433 family)